MGKSDEDEFTLNNNNNSDIINNNVNNNIEGERVNDENYFIINKIIGVKCIIIILLGISVLLSALFWLPPFTKDDLDLDPKYRGHTIVARFTLHEPASVVKDNTEKLETDIYYEIEAAHTKVTILSADPEPSRGPNHTTVVFSIDPESKHSSSISPFELSLIRSAFGYLVTKQTNLTTTLSEEDAFDFEVLKFRGGITIIPPHQFTFPLQNVQISFNFTLNNSIVQILHYFDDLEVQLKQGLHLSASEKLHIKITNYRGSTVGPPSRLQADVVQTVGAPSVPRLKQLAQTIKDNPKNLGLNNTVFGKVKQVSLSSFLKPPTHSPAPSPSPLPHGHHRGPYLPPSYAPSEPPTQPIKGSPSPKRAAYPPAGAPTHLIGGYPATPPVAQPPVSGSRGGCGFGHAGGSPVQAPMSGPPIVPPYRPPMFHHRHANSPSPVEHRISPVSPRPNVVYARVPPPEGRVGPDPPDERPSSIALAPSNEGGHIRSFHWSISALLVALLLQLW